MRKLNGKAFVGFGMAAIMGLVTMIGAIADSRREEKIDELIDRVDKLTENKKEDEA